MAGPWEKYQRQQQPAAGPWEKYATQQEDKSAGWWDTAKDVAGAAAAGVARGTADLVGIPGTISDYINNGLSYVTGLPQLPQSAMSGSSIRSAASSATDGATDFRGETTPGEYAGTIGEFVPGAVAFGGLSPSNIGRFAVLPGAASEAAGQATEGTALEPWARITAALLAPAAPWAIRKAITPNPVNAERAAAAAALRNEGITPTAGQLTGSRTLRAFESELGGGRTAQIMDDQARAFTDAAMRRAGASGLADPDNMKALNQRLSQGFDDISARNALRGDTQLGGDIGRTLRAYERVLPTEQRTIVQNLADDIIERFRQGGGVMQGKDYQTIRSRLTKTAHKARNSDTEFADAIRGLRNSLDDLMGRSVSPEDAAEWATLRREYGNMKVLEKAAAGAGENAAMGMISPSKLRQAASSGRAGQYARSEGDFDRLSRVAEALLNPLPDSGTAPRLFAKTIPALLAGGGAYAGGAQGAILGALAAPTASAAAGRALMSRPVQAYLSNQMLAPTRLADPRLFAVAQELLSQEADKRLRPTR